MHQTTAAIHALFLVVALLVSQSWSYFAVSPIEQELAVQLSDVEQGEEEHLLLKLSLPTPSEEREIQTPLPKVPKKGSKLTAFLNTGAFVMSVLEQNLLDITATNNGSHVHRVRTKNSGYPHSHGNRGSPLLS